MAKIRREALQGSDGWEGGRLDYYYYVGVLTSSSGVGRDQHKWQGDTY